MKMIITKKGIVDCTSDSRTYCIQSLQDKIDVVIKIFDKEVLELDSAHFNIYKNGKNGKSNEIVITDKKICLKLLNHFKNNPEELSTKESPIINIRVKLWKFFNDGNNCSDYIEIYQDRLEVSCQDYYDEDKRLEFHENVRKLIGEEYAVAIDEDLISLHINVTEKCSANCETCYVNKGLQRELEKEDWINLPISDQYAIGGGEPAEYPLIYQLVDFLKDERKGYVAITTNGQKIMSFNHPPDKIAVSIDGLTQKDHEKTHNTDLEIAEITADIYKAKGIDVCINHIVHRENIDNVKNFVDTWINNGYEINIILFKGKDDLKPTFEQLDRFKEYFDKINNEKIVIDSCMAGLLNIFRGNENYLCSQGLYSKYFTFNVINPCSHSPDEYPNCTIIEDYMKYYFNTLRPIVFIYDNDGTSGAHEWAFRIGYKGKIRHKIDKPLRKDVIYILTYNEIHTIAEKYYVVFFKNKMPYWLYHR